MNSAKDELQFQHLVLLIGENPLPNFVAAKYFLDKDRKEKNLKNISVIHTKGKHGTEKNAERLKLVLERMQGCSVPFHFCDLEDQGNARQVANDVLNKIPFGKNDTFHLNYTGGTKNMAVHAYLALFTHRSNHDFTNCSFSYLDAEDFLLKHDDGLPLSGDMRKEVNIDLENLLLLHHCHKSHEDEIFDWPEANNALKAMIKDGSISKFIKWRNEVLRPLFYRRTPRGEQIEKPEAAITRQQLEQHEAWQTIEPLLMQMLPESQRWKFNDDGILDLGSSSHFKNEFKPGVEFLDGKWFEAFALQEIRQAELFSDGTFQIASNWHIKRDGADKTFELDIMILYGYQLCGISLTTASDRRTCKSKAFEIMHRTRQIGGDEARSLLVTTNPAEKVEDLESDLLADTGRQTNIKVFGLEQLREGQLWTNIKEHMMKK